MEQKDLKLIIRDLKSLLSEFNGAYKRRDSYRTAKIRKEEIAKDQNLIDRVNTYIVENRVLYLAFQDEVDNNPMYLNEIRDELRHPEDFRYVLNEVIRKLESKNPQME